jgi:hypothetical protein
MSTEDVRVVLSSATGKTEYMRATVTRTLARKIESLLEQNGVFIEQPQTETLPRSDATYA